MLELLWIIPALSVFALWTGYRLGKRAAREQVKELKANVAAAATEVAHLVESKDRLADELRSARASRDTAVNLLDRERTRADAADLLASRLRELLGPLPAADAPAALT